jgi:hypothetical protein
MQCFRLLQGSFVPSARLKDDFRGAHPSESVPSLHNWQFKMKKIYFKLSLKIQIRTPCILKLRMKTMLMSSTSV